MLKDDARQAIIDKWRALPASKRKTSDQAAAFAMLMKEKYEWRSRSDRYQDVMGWLRPYIGKDD